MSNLLEIVDQLVMMKIKVKFRPIQDNLVSFLLFIYFLEKIVKEDP